MPKAGSGSDFYVYVLFDWLGVPRYVGKGRANRWLQHEQSKRIKSFIAQTILMRGDIPKIKIREGLSEHTAYSIEHAFIVAIGREPNGPLVNRTEKGSGPNSDQVRAWHARRTIEERRAHMQAAISASVAKRMQNRQPRHQTPMTPERRSSASRKAIAAQSAEQLSAIGRRRNEFITYETRSEIGRKRNAHMTDERRQENAKHITNCQTKEQLRENGRKGAAALSKSDRSKMAQKRAKTIGKNKLREIALKMVAARRIKREQRLLD